MLLRRGRPYHRKNNISSKVKPIQYLAALSPPLGRPLPTEEQSALTRFSAQIHFSVIVPCYNDGPHLGRCLESIVVQTHPAEVIIVVDDGSEDSTQEVCADYAERLGAGFIYHYQENAGVSAARNQGIELARANYLVFVDADDELAPEALSRYASSIQETIEDAGQPQWLIANSQWERDERIKSRSVVLPPDKPRRFKSFLDKELHLGNISNMCFAKSAFEQNMFPTDLRFGEDTVVFAILLTKVEPLLVPHTLALAHRREDSLRRQATLNDLIASQVHSKIFEHAQLPPSYQRFRARHWARNSRSIMRRAYREGEHEVVRHWYKEMLRSRPWYVLDVRLLLRFLQATFRLRN